MPTASHGMVEDIMDATQEHIVMGIMKLSHLHASHAPLDTIVQAGLIVMAIEN